MWRVLRIIALSSLCTGVTDLTRMTSIEKYCISGILLQANRWLIEF